MEGTTMFCHATLIPIASFTKAAFSMPKSKKSELQRQASEKLQARAAATIPLHRESIVTLGKTSIVPKPPGTMADSTNVLGGSSTQWDQLDRRRSSCQELPPQIGQWKTKLCGAVDCDTCVAAGWQRSQIRGTYGIEGNCLTDIVLGIFCSACVLIQNDREIRRRERDRERDVLLRNDSARTPKHNEKNYNAAAKLARSRERESTEMVQLQPSPKPTMVAPGLFKIRPAENQPLDNSLSSNETLTPAEQPGESPATMYEHEEEQSHQKWRRTQTQSLTRTFDQAPEQSNAAQSTKATEQTQKNPAKTLDQGNQQSERGKRKANVAGETQNNQAEKSELVILKKRHHGQEALPIVVVTGPEDTDKVASDTSNNNPSREHALIECLAPELVDEVGIRQNQPTSSAVDYTPREENQNGRLDLHSLSECSPTFETPSAQKGVIQQQALVECVRSSSTLSEIEEISYVHDFAECPGTILEYYKKGEKSQPRNPRNRTAEASTNNAKSSNRVKEHFLEDCSKRICENCEFIEKGASHKGLTGADRLTTHILGDCSGGISTVSKPPVQQHTFAGCPSERPRNSTAGSETQTRRITGAKDSSDDVTQHRLSSCPTPIPMTSNRVSDQDTCGSSVDGFGK
ncbi:hypothetical protein N431DRAFT_559503 [Stipitochalara longipes BDJ]|nr:hypothetical protein N431DRAFT_559503 [Stipitochalara longipes BDJ]